MSNNSEILKLEELYAVGPSISVLMEGYKDNKGLTSLRGTLVPAKTLNKLIKNSCNWKHSYTKRCWRGIIWSKF